MSLFGKQIAGQATTGGQTAHGVTTDGVTVPLKVDADGVLQTSVTGAGSGGTSSVDESTYTAGASAGTALIGARDDTATDTLAEDKLGIVRATEYRALHVNLRDASGNEVAVGGGTQYAEDVASVTDPIGTQMIARRRDTLSTETSTNGDNTAVNSTAKGEIYVKHVDDINVAGTVTANLGTLNGASTSAKQDTIIGHVDGIEGLLTTIDSDTGNISTKIDTLAGAVSGTEMQVDVVTSSLPIGASTATKQDSIITELQNIDGGKLEETTFTGRVGEVQASPTANTLLARLKTIGDNTTSVATTTKQDTIIGHLDGVEGLLTTIDADTGNVSTKIDTIAGAVAGTEVQVDIVSAPTLTVQATNLDVRDIDKATDDITVYANTVKDGSGSAYVPLVDADGHLQIDVLSGGGGGTQYTEGDTDASITGTAMLMEGATNTLSPVQGTVADGLLVNLGANNDVTVTGTVTANAGTDLNTSALALESGNIASVKTSVEIMDDWDESDRAKVNPIVGQAGVQGGSGVVGANTQRVVLATDVALPAGTNNIGDVDVLTVPVDPFGLNADAAATAGSTGSMQSKFRLMTSQLDSIKTAVETIDNAIAGTEMQVDVVSMPTVTIQDGGGSITVDGSVSVSGTPQVIGSVVHDGADADAPVKIGGRARTSERTAVANDDRVDAVFDVAGKQIVLPYANPENFVSGAITTAMTSTTSTSLLAAPGSGLRNYITTIIVSNSHATQGTDVIIQDGSGGTTLMTIPADSVYGGAVISLPTPLRQPTSNTALYCANVTSGASTKVSVVGYKGA